MRQEGETRVLVASVPLLNSGDRIGLPVMFGVGRKDRAVRLFLAYYHISALSPAAEGFERWGAALSQNPEDLLAPPSLTFAHDSEAIYAFREVRFEHIGIGASMSKENGLTIDLHGLLRPFRQILIFWNDTNANVKMRAEIYYAPTAEGKVDLESLNRQKGAYRRT